MKSYVRQRPPFNMFYVCDGEIYIERYYPAGELIGIRMQHLPYLPHAWPII